MILEHIDTLKINFPKLEVVEYRKFYDGTCYLKIAGVPEDVKNNIVSSIIKHGFEGHISFD